MKKLFTLCASALLAFTLSAQSEHAQGSMYLGQGDATELLNIFGNDGNGINLNATMGYAVRDNIVVMFSVAGMTHGGSDATEAVPYQDAVEAVDAVYNEESGLLEHPAVEASPAVAYQPAQEAVAATTENSWNLGVRYFGWKGLGVGIHWTNFNEAHDMDRSYVLEFGKYMSLGSISDRIYVYPNLTMDEDQNMSTAIEFGFRF